LKFFLCVMGMVLIVEGLPYFAFPDKIKAYLMKMMDVPDRTLRILGLASILCCLFVVYFGRS